MFGAPTAKPEASSPAEKRGGGASDEKPDKQPPAAIPPPASAEPARLPSSGADSAARSAAESASPAGSSTATPFDARDRLNLGEPGAGTRFADELPPEDPLKIGGQLYWRAMTRGLQGQTPDDWTVSTPALLDVYLDARPNDRVRAFVLGRMSYDPTRAPASSTSAAVDPSAGVNQNDSTSLMLFNQPTRGPDAYLDQMWLRFDIQRRVFVTAGKQHVRWGTARFWTPTDYLHLQPRNPLLPFDPRVGTTMLKLHIPWETEGWNFYAYALPEAPTATAATGDVAAAARAEIVLGTLEGGVGVFGRRNSKARFAADVSFGVWDLDLYGEVAVRHAGEVDFVRYDSTGGGTAAACTAQPPSYNEVLRNYFPYGRGDGWKAQATGGVSYSRQYADKDVFTLGAEYFYNGLGYSSPKDYPGLVFPRDPPLSYPATFFYLGRHYLGIFANVPAPYSWDQTTFTLSTLANLSDQSGITRLDYSLTVLTHIRFEAFGAVHWGRRAGEFRFGFNSADLPCPPSQPVVLSPSLFDLGVGLRVAL